LYSALYFFGYFILILGYVATQIFGGYLAPIMGAGRLLCLSIFGTSLLALATPIIAFSWGRYGLISVRVLQGLFQVNLTKR
jgi:MFS family permease